MPTLTFVEELATGLHDRLLAAGWQPAGEPAGPLLTPDSESLKLAVKDAFAVANETGSTLLISFIGHGVSTGESDFYLLTSDSNAAQPDSDSAFHFSQFVGERLTVCTGLDGLVFLVDSCQAKEGLEAAAYKWTRLLARNRGRMELLAASGSGNAYDGCFTRTILQTFDQGLPGRGDALLCADLLPQISATCRTGQAQHLAYSGGHLSSGDPGLWLVRNPARRSDAIRDRPAAGLVDQLTQRLIVTASMKETLADLSDLRAARLLLVTGPAGSGKSTVLSVLMRPQVVDIPDIPVGYVQAAVFLDTTSTLESVATECAAQLATTVPVFREATKKVQSGLTGQERLALNLFEVCVTLPLALCNDPGGRIRIILDGLDQPAPEARNIILNALHQVAQDPALTHVRVVAGVRSDEMLATRPELQAVPRIETKAPSLAEIAMAATQSEFGITEADLARIVANTRVGGWLIARLLRETLPRCPGESFADFDALVAGRIQLGLNSDCDAVDPAQMLGLIAAAGDRPVLPICLLAAALGQVSPGPIRDQIDQFGVLISRGNPGTDQEVLGISHLAILKAVNRYLEGHEATASLSAHQALIDAYQRLSATTYPVPDDVVAYWNATSAHHYLGAGQPDQALRSLMSLDGPRAADNRDRWSIWVPVFAQTVGSEHPATLTARGDLAHWRRESGDLAGAISEFQALLADQQEFLGPDHRNTLATRRGIAVCRGQSGDFNSAIRELEALVAHEQRVLGPDDPDTLGSRNDLAQLRGESGDTTGAISDLESLLPDLQKTLGADHSNTIASRINLARWRGSITPPAMMINDYEALLADVNRVLDRRDPLTLTIRSLLSKCRTANGDYERAISESEALLADAVDVLDNDHPHVLMIRNNLAGARFASGDFNGAITDYQGLLPDQRRVLGPDHPEVLLTRHNLGCSRAANGEFDQAIVELETVLADRARVLGSDHPKTTTTRKQLVLVLLTRLRDRDP